MKKIKNLLTLLVVLLCAFLIVRTFVKKREIDRVYAVDRNTLTIIGTRYEKTTAPSGPYSIETRYFTNFEIEASELKLVHSVNIIRPEFNLKTYDYAWLEGDSVIRRVGFKEHNTLYVERGGKISTAKVLYINKYDEVIRYNTLSESLEVTKLSPIEIHGLPKKIRAKINKGRLFIVDN